MRILKLPGLIDPHVHLREPGATHKEDFDSGTAAALAGGYTTVLAMPNTDPPLTDEASLALAGRAARARARCDVGIYLGAGPDNAQQAARLADRCCGLKLYLDQTYGPLRLDDLGNLAAHVAAWPADRPLAAHAEGRSLAALIGLAELVGRSVHICHVSRASEIALIRAAKEKGWPVTCEVSPHHLFLTEDDIPALGAGRAEVRPRLATAADRQALWDNLAVIDCIATDHAPHTLQEKDSETPPPGFPGLETALGLMLGAVQEGRLSLEGLIARMHSNPARIFKLQPQPETWIEVDPQAVWQVRGEAQHTRAAWSPFEGRRLRGRVRRVVMRGELAYEDDILYAAPGSGVLLSPTPLAQEAP